jgi:hypothetical protein
MRRRRPRKSRSSIPHRRYGPRCCPGFSVDPYVELRGYMAHFTLDTPLGALKR